MKRASVHESVMVQEKEQEEAEGESNGADRHGAVAEQQKKGDRVFFSDRRELASYLHLRAQEIGKQLRHCSFLRSAGTKKRSSSLLPKGGLNPPQNPSVGSGRPGDPASQRYENRSAVSPAANGTFDDSNWQGSWSEICKLDSKYEVKNLSCCVDGLRQSIGNHRRGPCGCEVHTRRPPLTVETFPGFLNACDGLVPRNEPSINASHRCADQCLHKSTPRCNNNSTAQAGSCKSPSLQEHGSDAVLQVPFTDLPKKSSKKPGPSGNQAEDHNQACSIADCEDPVHQRGDHSCMPSMWPSVSCVDSSECDNCGPALSAGIVAEDASLRTTRFNNCDYEDIDAMSEAGHLEMQGSGKEEEEDKGDIKDGRLLKCEVHSVALCNDNDGALDLLLTAMNVVLEGASGKNHDDCTLPLDESVDHEMSPRDSSAKMGTSGGKDEFAMGPPSLSEQNLSEGASHASNGIITMPLRLGGSPLVKKRVIRCARSAYKQHPLRASLQQNHSIVEASQAYHGRIASKKGRLMNKQDGNNWTFHDEGQGVSLLISEPYVAGRGKKRQCANKQGRIEWPLCSKQEGKKEGDTHDFAMSVVGVKGVLGVLSRTGRSQVLPTKFSDSILQPWKKTCRRKQ